VALFGAALATHPLRYAIRPLTAYQVVCNCASSSCPCGSACCDGYTEFCCTLFGKNQCPPGTVIGGWWLAEGPGTFCGGAPRYYMDCNASCGGCGCGSSGICAGSCSGTVCECAFGDCNNRRTGCVMFRYGQCNQQLSCLGPIVCRVVTCIPPWEIDPTCTTTVAVDNATYFHDAPCLHTSNPPVYAPTLYGQVTSVALSGGEWLVSGWVGSNEPGVVPEVSFTIDGLALASVAATGPAPQSAFSSGAQAAASFSFSTPQRPYPARLCASAAATGFSPLFLGCFDLTPPTLVTGAVDAVMVRGGVLEVTGWAVDETTAAATVEVLVDGAPGARGVADLYRPDVAQAFSGMGPFHGFRLQVAVGPGTHRVTTLVVSGGPTPTVIDDRSVVVPGASPVFGSLDSVTPVGARKVAVAGWAIDTVFREPPLVVVEVDGAPAARVRANLERQDVAAAYPGYGPFWGFQAVVSVAPGLRRVCATAWSSRLDGPRAELGCKDVVMTV
jgi:hypothetical protein